MAGAKLMRLPVAAPVLNGTAAMVVDVEEPILLRYDYSTLPEGDRAFVQHRAEEIRLRERRAARDVVEIGCQLLEVKERLQHGQFGEWVDQEFGWSSSMAANFMNVARKFPKFGNLEAFGMSALYLLAAPSTPDGAVAEAQERAGAGERISHKTAKAIVEGHKVGEAPALSLDETTAAVWRWVKAHTDTSLTKRCYVLEEEISLAKVATGVAPGQRLDPAVYKQAHGVVLNEVRGQMAHEAKVAARRAGMGARERGAGTGDQGLGGGEGTRRRARPPLPPPPQGFDTASGPTQPEGEGTDQAEAKGGAEALTTSEDRVEVLGFLERHLDLVITQLVEHRGFREGYEGQTGDFRGIPEVVRGLREMQGRVRRTRGAIEN